MTRQLSAPLLGLCVLLLPATARAHGIESSLTRLQALSAELMLQSQFSSGEPTRDAVVRLVPPGGQPIEVGRTNAQGQLSFALPKGASGAWEVQVDGGPGHRDYLEMPVQRGQAQLDQLSQQHQPGGPLGGLPLSAGLSGLGAAAMLLGLQRIRRPR
jgi:nickel transport protein